MITLNFLDIYFCPLFQLLRLPLAKYLGFLKPLIVNKFLYVPKQTKFITF